MLESAPLERRVLVVEDDAGWRAVYGEILSEAGYSAECAASYGEARTWLQRAAFSLAIVDLHLASSADRHENRDGFSFLRVASQRGLPAIVVSALGAPDDIDRAYEEFGAWAFIEKERFDRQTFVDLLAEAVDSVRPPVEDLDPARLTAPVDALTDREQQVLSLLAKGETNRQIARALDISPNTVKKHVAHILEKLGVSNRAGAVAAALRDSAQSLSV